LSAQLDGGTDVSNILDLEIREQPQSLLRLLQHGRPRAEEIAAAIRAYRPRYVVIAARGSSDNAARYGSHVFGAHNHLTVALATPSLFTRYEACPSLEGALVIGISQSGQSPDVVAVLDAAREQKAVTIAVTQDETSPLAKAATWCFPLLAGEERAVAATKTYTAQLMVMAMLSAALEGSKERWSELEAIPGEVNEAIRLNESLEDSADRFKYVWRLVLIGRGFNYSTACEIALKIKETSYAMADAYSPADFQHGPVAMLDQNLPLFLVAPASRVSEDVDKILEIGRTRKADIIAISDRDDILAVAKTGLRLPSGIPEWLTPIVAVVPGQLWAQAFAVARGARPDEPRGLSKVTLTH
jgi:glutamine---fructose-6-phosphate transaminase (isomerizing)